MRFKALYDPRFLLKLDAVGAISTAVATYFVLASEILKTGLPSLFLQAMAAVALGFAGFDVIALLMRSRTGVALRIIASLNLAYCVAMMLGILIHRATVTSMGLAYFFTEIAIVGLLAFWEISIAARE